MKKLVCILGINLMSLALASVSCSKGISYPPCFLPYITLPSSSIAREFEDLNNLKAEASRDFIQGAGFNEIENWDDVDQWWVVRFDNPRGWLHVKSHVESIVMSTSSPAFTKLGEESAGTGKDAVRFCLYSSSDQKYGVSLFDFGENKELEKEIGQDMCQYSITVYKNK